MTQQPPSVPPHNEEAEQALLGAILVNNRALDKVREAGLEAIHFYDPLHARIYEAAIRMVNAGRIASPVTLKGWFEADPDLGGEGSAYLAELAASVVTVINARDYATTIMDCFVRRMVVEIGQDASGRALALEWGASVDELLDEVQMQLFDLSAMRQGRRRAALTMGAVLDRTLARVDAAFKAGGKITGMTTGLADLDWGLSGLHKGRLLILAGRPSMGKSALASAIGRGTARSGGHHVGLFSQEMSAEDLGYRDLAAETGIPADDLLNGRVATEDWPRLQAAREALAALPIMVDDTAAVDLGHVRTRVREWGRRRPIDTVIIDHLQLMRGAPGTRYSADRKVALVSDITGGAKQLAKDLDVAVVLLSQLSRAVELREDKRPQLADLRESGSIEQDADVVAFIYRESYYLERSEPAQRAAEKAEAFEERYREWERRKRDTTNLAEVIIAKNRHGPTTTVRLHFDPPTMVFSGLARRGGGA